MQMDKNTPYDAPLQGSNRNYDTGIGTTNIRPVSYTHLDVYKRQILPTEDKIYDAARTLLEY